MDRFNMLEIAWLMASRGERSLVQIWKRSDQFLLLIDGVVRWFSFDESPDAFYGIQVRLFPGHGRSGTFSFDRKSMQIRVLWYGAPSAWRWILLHLETNFETEELLEFLAHEDIEYCPCFPRQHKVNLFSKSWLYSGIWRQFFEVEIIEATSKTPFCLQVTHLAPVFHCPVMMRWASVKESRCFFIRGMRADIFPGVTDLQLRIRSRFLTVRPVQTTELVSEFQKAVSTLIEP